MANEPQAPDAEAIASEAEAIASVASTVDTSERGEPIGEGRAAVYAYGYRCAPGWLKIGMTEGDVVQRIAAQIGPSTPGKLVLYLRSAHIAAGLWSGRYTGCLRSEASSATGVVRSGSRLARKSLSRLCTM